MQPPIRCSTRAIDNATLWQLHLAVARNARQRGDQASAARAMSSARAHAAARKLAERLS